jgi:hypothetical protein
MKRKSFRDRALPFPADLARSIDHQCSNLVHLPSRGERRGVRARKIFVIKHAIRGPAKNAARKTGRRVLIFDNHPDSLRLVFGRPNPHVDPSALQRASWRELVLLWMLAVGLLIAMFWPLF